jgi:hypothetical protein
MALFKFRMSSESNAGMTAWVTKREGSHFFHSVQHYIDTYTEEPPPNAEVKSGRGIPPLLHMSSWQGQLYLEELRNTMKDL